MYLLGCSFFVRKFNEYVFEFGTLHVDVGEFEF
jgi:hypothetical protein